MRVALGGGEAGGAGGAAAVVEGVPLLPRALLEHLPSADLRAEHGVDGVALER